MELFLIILLFIQAIHVCKSQAIIQLGHDKRTYETEGDRRLPLQAIKYLAITN